MSDATTSIFDLPTDPSGGNERQTVVQNTMQQGMQPGMQQGMPQGMQPDMNAGPASSITLDQTTINQIVNGLQQASTSGATQLPSRDIPMTTSNLTHDVNIQPNYIPPPPQNTTDYIQNYEQAGDIINDYNANLERSSALDDMYSEIQVPLLLAVLYFLFQLPFFRKFMFSYLPVLFSKDGNLNLNGYIFMSCLFGIFYYLLNKVNTRFGKF
jgi:hypothetical protein